MEQWRPIPGLRKYAVSDRGRVWSFWGKGKLLRQRFLRPTGGRRYIAFALYENGTRRQHLAHRLVLEAFVGPCPPGHEGAHLDGSRDNNTPSNLAWVTPSENSRHRKEHGRTPDLRGERHPSVKLTEDDVLAIRSEYVWQSQTHGTTALAKKYGVHHAHIADIIKRGCWSHI